MMPVMQHAGTEEFKAVTSPETVTRPETGGPDTHEPDGQARVEARKHIEKRRGLQGGFAAYVIVNAFLVGVWALSGGGYFWPAWVIAAWGLGMVFGVWDYLRGPVSEADVDAELRRMESRGR